MDKEQLVNLFLKDVSILLSGIMASAQVTAQPKLIALAQDASHIQHAKMVKPGTLILSSACALRELAGMVINVSHVAEGKFGIYMKVACAQKDTSLKEISANSQTEPDAALSPMPTGTIISINAPAILDFLLLPINVYAKEYLLSITAIAVPIDQILNGDSECVNVFKAIHYMEQNVFLTKAMEMIQHQTVQWGHSLIANRKNVFLALQGASAALILIHASNALSTSHIMIFLNFALRFAVMERDMS